MRWLALVLLATSATAGVKPPPAHLATWTSAWHDLRACLVGDPQAAQDVGDAFTLRELTDGHACEPAVQRALAVAREADDDAGYHVAWRVVAEAVAALDRARVAARSDYIAWNFQRVGANVEVDAAQAIARVDDADRVLRGAARAQPSVIAIAQPPLESLAPGASLGVQGYDFIAGRVRDHAIEVLVGPTELAVVREPGVIHREPAWTAETSARGIVVGTSLVMAGAGLTAADTFQRDGARAVLVARGDRHWLVRSTDQGAHWDTPVAIGPAARRSHTFSGEDVLVWPDRDGSALVVVDGGVPGKPRHIAAKVEDVACVFGDTTWWSGAGGPHVADADRVRDLGNGTPLACTHDHLVVERPGAIRTCDHERCRGSVEDWERAQRRGADIDDDGDPVVAEQLGAITRVTRGGKSRTFHLDATLVGLVVWSGHPILLVSDGELRTVALP